MKHWTWLFTFYQARLKKEIGTYDNIALLISYVQLKFYSKANYSSISGYKPSICSSI